MVIVVMMMLTMMRIVDGDNADIMVKMMLTNNVNDVDD